MDSVLKQAFFALTIFSFCAVSVYATSVAVHDPSVVLVYKDAAGNSYPEQDAKNSRTKFYYIFGTQMGAAYSKDLIDWTEFKPTFTVNGKLSTDYAQILSVAAKWSKHNTSDDVLGNYWAPDIIYNKNLKKWCLYYSENGDDWLSSIGLLTSDKIEGPYEYAGTVVYGGMDEKSSGTGNEDYKKVMGTSTIASRYMKNGSWIGEYGVSCIDPNVFYDEDGNLWLLYGSWSGGLFMLKLDKKTGLRDYTQTYGKNGEAVWSGTALQSDPYMGIHVGGGYYVSGEGSYIKYMKNQESKGYYFMFVSYGFYSPDGGYTMRVFRSDKVTGPYTDVTGDPAIFSKYIYNYGLNTTYGFPIIQSYRWSFWDENHGEIADGHNSLLTDDDGRNFVVYHRKMTNNTAWHNVEVHELVMDKNDWVEALPFEHRLGYGVSKTAVNLEEIAGHYKMILHEPFAQKDGSRPVNLEKDLYLNADGTLSGNYSGTWNYDFQKGKNFIDFKTTGENFTGVLAVQLMNDVSKKTTTFTAMNAKGERALWGYKVPETKNLEVKNFVGDSVKTIGGKDIAWNDYEKFEKVNGVKNFAAEFEFENNSLGNENWNHWILAFKTSSGLWYLRADAYSVESFSGSSVGYYKSWNNDWEKFKAIFKNAKVKIKAVRSESTINVFVYAKDSLVYAASATNTPDSDYEIYLGADNAELKISKVSIGENLERILVGEIDDAGNYTSAFNAKVSQEFKAPAGNFKMNLKFANYGNGEGASNWDNFLIRENVNGKTMILRADVYALDALGNVKFSSDWDWDNFSEIMRNANVDLSIERLKDTIHFAGIISAENGDVYHYGAIQTGAPTDEISFSLSVEKSAVDLFEVSSFKSVGKIIPSDTTKKDTSEIEKPSSILEISKNAQAKKSSVWLVRKNGNAEVKMKGKSFRINGKRM